MINLPCNWICCQIGARENYSIPRIFHQQGQLLHLITDAWVKPQSIFNLLPQNSLANLRERYHPDLSTASVSSYTNSLIPFEILQNIRKKTGWEKIIARNYWFQKQAITTLKSISGTFTNSPVLFSYSYAALELFRFAKQQGWYTVLGQIDPGIEEEKIVIREYERYPEYRGNWQAAPVDYWQKWQEECSIADAIVVNSHWSYHLLAKSGIDSRKIHVIPLVYTPPLTATNFVRTYPDSFTKNRPLRILFLGQVILRKGIAAVLDAVNLLVDYPVEFWIVGSQQIDIPSHLQTHPQIRWIGHVNRSETAQFYQNADVFLFPTLSDGFGLTQLEAQVWKLPVITSAYCGEVVKDSINGLILKEVSGEAIANLIIYILDNQKILNHFSENVKPEDNSDNIFKLLENTLIQAN